MQSLCPHLFAPGRLIITELGSFSAWLKVYLTYPGGIFLFQAVAIIFHHPQKSSIE